MSLILWAVLESCEKDSQDVSVARDSLVGGSLFVRSVPPPQWSVILPLGCGLDTIQSRLTSFCLREKQKQQTNTIVLCLSLWCY